MVDDAYVMEVFADGLSDERTHARPVYFDGQVVIFRMSCSELQGCIAHAWANVKDHRRRSAEMLCEVKCLFGKINAVMRPVFFQGASLAAGQASPSQDKAAYCAVVCDLVQGMQ